MIKAVFFDFDGVLTTEETGAVSISRALAKKTGKSFKLMKKYYDKARWGEDFGKVGKPEILKRINKLSGESISNKEFDKLLLDVVANKEALKLAKQIKKNYKTGIITDNWTARFQLLKKKMNLDDYFDTFIVSSRVRATKKTGKIFKVALKRLGVKPSETVFIDNNIKNVRMARSLGITGIHYESYTHNIKYLKDKLKDAEIA